MDHSSRLLDIPYELIQLDNFWRIVLCLSKDGPVKSGLSRSCLRFLSCIFLYILESIYLSMLVPKGL